MAFEISSLKHDNTVRDLALHYLARGYEVKARIEGWFDLPE